MQKPNGYSAEEMLAEMDAAGVDRAVIVPPTYVGEGNETALEVHQQYPKRFAIMGRFDVDGLLYFMAGATALLAIVTFVRARTRAAPEHQERPFEILAPQAARIAHDPAGAAEADAEPVPA